MSDQNIFNNQNTTQTPANSNTDPNSNQGQVQTNNTLLTMLNDIKNERGEPKYKTVEDAINALRHSQEYIPQLKTELETLRSERERLSNQAQRVDELERTLQALSQNNNRNETTPSNTVSEEQIADLVNRALTKITSEKTQKENQNEVVQAAIGKFGDKASEVFYEKAKEFGITVEQINSMARQTPKVVLRLLGLEGQTQQQTKSVPYVPGGVNTAGFQPAQTSFIKSNSQSVMIGATSDEVKSEMQNAKQLVDELHSQGKTIHDLTNPKTYFQVFKRDK